MGMVLDFEEQMLKDTARNWFEQFSPVSELRRLRDAGDSLGFDRRLWRQMVDLGWSAMPWDERFGGLGFGYRGLGVVMEEAGRTLSASPLLATVWLSGSLIDLLGTDQQRCDLLTAIARGDRCFAAAIEEGATHEPATIRTIARAARDGYVLTGSKTFVIEALSADTILVLALTKGRSGGDGRAIFVVDPNQYGVQVTEVHMADSRAMAMVALDGVAVPASAILGGTLSEETAIDRALDITRIGLAAEMLGSAWTCLERTVEYLQQREQFGRRLSTFQSLRHRCADMLCELEMATSIVREALGEIDNGRDAKALARLASLAKAEVGEAAKKVSREAIQMHGGIGMTDEFDIGFFMKRIAVAEQLFGTAGYHRDRFAALGGY